MADLTQYGVPTGSNTMAMPKLQYRFRVNLYNFGRDSGGVIALTQNAISVTRPSLTHDEITLDSYNSRAYLAAKHTWEPITLTLRDDINNTVTRMVASQLQKQLNHGAQSAPASGFDYKFGMVIEQLDGSQGDLGAVIETWSLNGCFIQNVNYGENNYATSDVMTITLQIRYDGADIHDAGQTSATTTGGLTDTSMNTRSFNKATS